MGLVAIGPIAVSHGDPVFGVGADPTDHGMESVTIAGSCSWAAWHSLRELVGNPATRITKGGHDGVLEWLEFDDDLLGPLSGDYILERFTGNVAQKDSLTTTDAPFTLQAAFIPETS